MERARRAIRVFVLMRRLSLAVNGETETQLPLVRAQQCICVSDVLDLNNADLIACTGILIIINFKESIIFSIKNVV